MRNKGEAGPLGTKTTSVRQVCAKAAPPSTEPRRLAFVTTPVLLPSTSHIKPSPIPTAIYPKLTMEFEGGSAFDSVSASVLGPAPVGEPASKGGPQAEFDIPDRINLLTTLKNTLNADLPPTIWACLWLSDIDKLKELVDTAKRQPVVLYGFFRSIESEAKIVQKCETCVLITYIC